MRLQLDTIRLLTLRHAVRRWWRTEGLALETVDVDDVARRPPFNGYAAADVFRAVLERLSWIYGSGDCERCECLGRAADASDQLFERRPCEACADRFVEGRALERDTAHGPRVRWGANDFCPACGGELDRIARRCGSCAHAPRGVSLATRLEQSTTRGGVNDG